MADIGEKEGKTEIQKSEYLENDISFLEEKVSISYLFSFLGYQIKCVVMFFFKHLMTS